jgi:hypothetical protein
MNECIRGRPRPALALQTTTIHCKYDDYDDDDKEEEKQIGLQWHNVHTKFPERWDTQTSQ